MYLTRGGESDYELSEISMAEDRIMVDRHAPNLGISGNTADLFHI